MPLQPIEVEKFEETTLSEPEKKRREKRTLTVRYARYLLLLVMVMVALIFLFSNRDQINGDNFRRLIAKVNIGTGGKIAENGEFRFDTSSEGVTVVFKDGFAHATVEKMIITDKDGTEFQNTQLGFRTPRLLTNGQRVMAFDHGGTGILIADSFSVLHEQQMENRIITADMSGDGWYVVVTEGDGYLAKVFVYNASFQEVYRYRSLSRYILDAALTPDHKALAVSALNSEGEDILPEILYFKLKKEEIAWTVPFEEAPCVDITVKEDGTVCGLFSWGIVSLNGKGTETGRFTLEDRILQTYSFASGDYNVAVTSAAESGASTVSVCDARGKVRYTVELPFYAYSVDYKDGRIAAMGTQTCSVYSTSGKTLWESSSENATSIALMGKNAVAVITPQKCVYNAF